MSRVKIILNHKRFRRLIWLVLTVFVLLGYSLHSVAGNVSYSMLIHAYGTVSSPPVILEEGNVTDSSTIYTNKTSAKVNVTGPVPIYDFIDNNTSDVDNSTNKGTHSNFPAQQSGPDATYDILTEENIGSVVSGVGTETTIYASLYDATDEYSSGPELVFISDQVGYVFFQVSRTASLSYSKTTNGGTSWGSPVDMTGGVQYTYRSRSVWYDKWTPGDTGTEIHIIVDGYDDDDVHYWSLDTSDDSVTGPVLVRSGTSYNAPNMAGMVTKSTDGYLFSVCADGGGNVYFDKSETGGSSWSSIDPGYTFLSDGDDHAQLLPLADGDVLCIYFDGSAGTLYSFRWDEATDQWDSEGNVVTVLTGLSHVDYFNSWGAVQKTGEYDVYLAINNALDTAGADLVCYKYTASSNSWASQGNIYTDIGTANMDVKLVVDANKGDLYAIYSRGTWQSTVDIYYKQSTNDGVSWGTETSVSSSTADDWRTISTNFRSDERLYTVWFDDDDNYLYGNTVANISPNYELDLEVQWTGVDYDEPNEYLCIYGGNMASENLQVDVWNSSQWTIIIPKLNATTWNNVSISSYLTSSTFTIRFLGTNETNDVTQSSWNIDATLLHVWKLETYDYVLRVNNTVTDSWQIRLKKYSDSNISRLQNCTIYFHNSTDGTSDQIYIENGDYKQDGDVGPWYDLTSLETIYIAMTVKANSTATSYVYTYLEILTPSTSTYAQYIITFGIT